MKILTTTLAIGLLTLSGTAAAHHKPGHHQGPPARQFEAQHDRYDYAPVVDVRPIYREVEVSRPLRECWDEPVYRDGRGDGHGRHASAGDMLAGGIIGGIIGHQIGRGEHRPIATAVGTLIGAQIGREAAGDHGRRHGRPKLAGYRERCETTHRVSVERVVDGYAVTYRYQGRRYEIEMPYHPGKRIKLHVQATPVL